MNTARIGYSLGFSYLVYWVLCLLRVLLSEMFGLSSKVITKIALKFETRELILNDRDYFEKEIVNHGPLVPFNQCDRTCIQVES